MKNIISILLTFLAVQLFGQGSVQMDGNIGPTGPYPIVWSKHMKGGLKSVQTITQRNAIPANFLEPGSLVRVTDSSKTYIRLENNTWAEFPTAGYSFLEGTGAPSSGLGKDGDMYIDNATGNYYKKESGSWVLKGSFVGPSGGATKWLSGSGAPSSGTGVVDDFYVNTANGDVYQKTGASTWTLRLNITGPPGADGGGGGTSKIPNIEL